MERQTYIEGRAYDPEDRFGVIYQQDGPDIFSGKTPCICAILSRINIWELDDHHVGGLVDG